VTNVRNFRDFIECYRHEKTMMTIRDIYIGLFPMEETTGTPRKTK